MPMTDMAAPDTHRTPDTGHPPVSGRTANRLAAAFYVAVAAIALAGQTSAAVHWLGWPLYAALTAVGVLELSAIALAARADYRRRLGETALAARVLSAAVAAFMTGINYVGHVAIGQPIPAALFGVATALGYLVWLINSGDRRRDQLRAEGKLRATTPDYGVWQWVRHPQVTRRARDLALRDPTLGVHGSLDLAREQMSTEKRNAAVAKILHRTVTATVDQATAELAVHVYDLDEIARHVAAKVDYERMTDLIAARLSPDTLVGVRRRGRKWTRREPVEVTGSPLPVTSTPAEPDTSEPVRPDSDATVVSIDRPATRTRSRASTAPATAGTPTVQQMADTLCQRHCADGPVRIGKPKALATLRQVYRSCSADRALAAKNEHNERHGLSDQAESDDPEERAA